MAHSEGRLYVTVFAALVVMTLVTVAVSYVDLGPLSVVVALTIAFTKALLVVLFFMHLRESSGLIWVVAGGGFFWLAILIALTMSDVMTRGWLPLSGAYGGWRHAAAGSRISRMERTALTRSAEAR